MHPRKSTSLERREFLKLAGATTVVGLTRNAAAHPSPRIALLLDAADRTASSEPVRQASQRLQKNFSAKGVRCDVVASLDGAAGADLCIVVASRQSPLASGFRLPTLGHARDESIVFAPGRMRQTPSLLISGIGERGFVYGLLELAERVQFGFDPIACLHFGQSVAEEPANEVRSVSRYFCCELEDKPWYCDKDFWREYLDVIVASRFNRFTLAYGLEYDFPKGVTDDYLHFPYPYLVDVPGYSQVRVLQLATAEGQRLPTPVPLSGAERDRNMEMLRFVAAEAGARGLHFQLGIWTHAYEWTDSPNAYHHIEGLTPEIHAQYCRDALAILLREGPQIQGLTMRVHGESGIPEGSYAFWKTLFEAISGCGRTVEIDMHAKGVDQKMIETAVATGMPVKLGAKYSAEHQSLGYHQADIRALEIPKTSQMGNGPFSLSGGARLFTRYGYADFLEKGSRAQVLFRLWPGTQRHLLSADPELCAAFGRSSHFCGATGIDLMEPLTFKGREGSGHGGGRCAYADKTLEPTADWQKFEYYYRLWGRHLYDPDVNPEVWRRYLRANFGAGAELVETALANGSRILPLVTSAHLPSASNHAFWPELDTNMPIVLSAEPSPYSDTPSPKCFGTVSPLDPQLFSSIAEYVNDLMNANPISKYSPIEVAQWLEGCASTASAALAGAGTKAADRTSTFFRRVEEDVLIQIGLGQFFAGKLRSGVLFEIFQRSGNAEAGKRALDYYRHARDAWAKMAERARSVYAADVSYGSVAMRRGHWADRLPDIDRDLAAMQKAVEAAAPEATLSETATRVLRVVASLQGRPKLQCHHAPQTSFEPGQPLSLALTGPGQGARIEKVVLHYRHVNQGERWRSMDAKAGPPGFAAEISSEYTNSPFALQYYFEVQVEVAPCGVAGCDERIPVGLYPGFNGTLSNQPYFVVAQRA